MESTRRDRRLTIDGETADKVTGRNPQLLVIASGRGPIYYHDRSGFQSLPGKLAYRSAEGVLPTTVHRTRASCITLRLGKARSKSFVKQKYEWCIGRKI
jgi:hypothetical protein